MGKGERFLQSLAEGAEILGEPIPGQPVIEIAGDSRVLIENHLGVEGYSREKICVKLKQGSVQVCGCGLELVRMNKVNLVIRGKIDCVTLHRRKSG